LTIDDFTIEIFTIVTRANMSKWKYLIAYAAPLSAILGLYLKGWWSPGAMYVGFLIIPLIEGLFYSEMGIKISSEEKRSPILFNLFLYLNIPLLYFILFYYFYTIQHHPELAWAEHLALMVNVGLIIGTSGINVAHELGHRKERYHHWMSWILLLPALYLHFFIEHNKGHHRNIATALDPATARKGEPIYSFWLRSMRDSYVHAWKLEAERLRGMNRNPIRFNNLMLKFQVATLGYLILIGILFSFNIMIMAILIGLVGVLFLESVNYIEHYGLLRKINADGTPGPIHEGLSWDADQPLGRIFLYELTRHADHHTNATIPYQDLKPKIHSPKLAYGYPASILLALVPAWWFCVMDKRLG
jgi:alkane 1-monooxygenase